MTKQQKLLTALTRHAKKTKNPKLKAKIKAIKQREVNYNWLAQ